MPVSNTNLQAAVLFLAVSVSQLANIVYEKARTGEDVTVVFLPSLMFLSVLTIPSLIIGFKLGKEIGLSLNQPHPSYTQNENYRSYGIVIASSLLLGFFLLAVRQFSLPYLPDEIPQYGFRGVTGGLLVSIGAAIGEEVWFRFGLMTLLLWLLKRAFKLDTLRLIHVWTVMIVVAIGFGAAHLPQLISYGAGTHFAIWGTMAGNLVVSFLYGWCYWRYGLVSAILAHFSLDLVLHVFPALI